MGLFKKKSSSFTQNPDSGAGCCDKCCACDLVDSFVYNSLLRTLEVTSECGNTAAVDISSLGIIADVLSVSYDPVTFLYTIKTVDGLTYTVSAIQTSSGVTVSNTLFVMPSGDDGTGTRERLDLPYATPWAAVAAASSGDTVVVFPGTYANVNTTTTDYLAKNGVTIHMHKGAIISYTGSANTIRPLYDQGVATTFTITGQGTLQLTQFTSGGTGVANLHASSSSVYNIELDSLTVRNRWRSSSGGYLKIKSRLITLEQPEFIAFRNAAATASVFILEADEITQTGASNILTPFDFRNFSTTGSVNINVKTFKAGRVFGGLGVFYFDAVHGSVNMKIDRFIENNTNLSGTRPIFYVANGIGEFDIDIRNINHTGGLFNFASAGAVVTRGKLKLHGLITPYTGHTCTMVFNTGSKVEIDLDIVYNDLFGTEVFTMTNVKDTVFVTGKIKHTIGAQNPATSFMFRNENSGGVATSMATLKNLTVQTGFDYLVNGAGPLAGNVKCMGVYSNKPLGANHTATIEPIVVDASITV
jgi:hypothetical protein